MSTHFKRNVLDRVPKRLRDEVAARLRLLFHALDMDTARRLLDDILSEYEHKAPQAMDCLERGFDDAAAVMALPDKHRRRLRSTNVLERLIREVRCRERVIGVFLTLDSALRLLGAHLIELDE